MRTESSTLGREVQSGRFRTAKRGRQHVCTSHAESAGNAIEGSNFPHTEQMMRLSPTARARNPGGYIVSVVGVDCMQLNISLVQFPLPIAGLLLSPIVFYLLSVRVGVGPSICCAAWILLAIVLPFPMSRFQNALWVSLKVYIVFLIYFLFLFCSGAVGGDSVGHAGRPAILSAYRVLDYKDLVAW